MPINLNCNTCQFDHVSCYNTCHVSGNWGAVRRKFLYGPTKVLWLFLQVLKTSQKGEVLSQFLIYTIMFIFSGVEHWATGLRHRLPAAFLHLLQANKVRHRLQGTCDLSGHPAVGRKCVCSRPSCCGFCCRFWKPHLTGEVLSKFILTLLWSFISGFRCLPPPGVRSCSRPRLQSSKVRQISFSLHMT
jgi:hypothetical protein